MELDVKGFFGARVAGTQTQGVRECRGTFDMVLSCIISQILVRVSNRRAPSTIGISAQSICKASPEVEQPPPPFFAGPAMSWCHCFRLHVAKLESGGGGGGGA